MKKRKPLLVNFIGAPGAGKSTLAAAVFAKLKMHGISCELVDEYVKGAVWEDRMKIIHNQLYLLSKQYQKIARIDNNVDIIITDSPIILNIYYNRLNAPDNNFKEETLAPLVLECYNAYDNINVFVKRHYKYEQKGRYQSEEQANQMEKEIESIYHKYNIPFASAISSENNANDITNLLINFLQKRSI